MKDQYVGDVNDYFKYALLRAWVDPGLSVAMGWMRTEADGSNDGALLGYRSRPDEFRGLDGELLDVLENIVDSGPRTVRSVAASGVLRAVVSHEAVIEDPIAARRRWFEQLRASAEGAEVVFLDPDNGLEVSSVPYGRRGSRRYVFQRGPPGSA